MAGKGELWEGEPLEVLEEVEEGDGNKGKRASPGQGRRGKPLSRSHNEILIAVLKKKVKC